MCIASSPPQPSESSRRAVALTCRCTELHGFLACAATWREGSTKRPSPARACGEHREKCSVGGFYLVRTAHPTAGGTVLPGFAAYLHPDFATAWVARPRFGLCRIDLVAGGPPLLPIGDGVWWAGGGRHGRVRAVVPAGQSLADGSAPFFTRFASKAAEGLFARNKHAGRGGRPPYRAGPGPILSRQADSR